MSIDGDYYREQANILRSLADEWESIATHLDGAYAPSTPVQEHFTVAPASQGVAETDQYTWIGPEMENFEGCNITYNVTPRVRLETIVDHAMMEVNQGKTVRLRYEGYPELTTILFKDNLDQVVIPRPW